MAVIKLHSTSSLDAEISLPSSKSESNRALIIQYLCKESFEISNLSEADDTGILAKLLYADGEIFDTGAAGTAFRFLTAVFSITPGTRILTGSERMLQRPVKELVEALKQLGADIEYLDQTGFPPLKISGKPLSGGDLEINAGVSSQFISGLLMIAPLLKDGLKLKLKGNVISRPYIEMTLSMMNYFGINYKWQGDNFIKVEMQQYIPRSIKISPDWSSASYWYAMAALQPGSSFLLSGLSLDSWQGDKVAAEIFAQLGVLSRQEKNGMRIFGNEEQEKPQYFEYDFTNCPDLAQTLAVTCAGLNIKSRLKGLGSLRIKETDRIAALKNELEKFGKEVEVTGDGQMKIAAFPFLKKPCAKVKTYSDHRMALSFAPLVLLCGEFEMEQPEVVKKSYPKFWLDLEKPGIKKR